MQLGPSSSPSLVDPNPPSFVAILHDDSLSGGLQLEDFDTETDESDPEKVETSSAVVDSLPAFVIGFATSVFFCAGYAIVAEMRKRCKDQGLDTYSVGSGTQNHKQRIVNLDSQSIVAASMSSDNRRVTLSTAENNMTSFTRNAKYYEKGPGGILYPIILVGSGSRLNSIFRKKTQDEGGESLFEERSLSAVSTMTSSVVELTDCHRVPKNIRLQNLVNLGDISEPVASSSSQVWSIVTLPMKGAANEMDRVSSDEAKARNEEIMGLEESLQKVTLSDFDCVLPKPSSAMAEASAQNDHSISEEDESGWTSSAGKSDSSSDVSIGTYLRSVCSAGSPSSTPSTETGKTSVLLGEALAPAPEIVSRQERREDENSVEISLDDDSLVISECQTETSFDYGEKCSMLSFDTPAMTKDTEICDTTSAFPTEASTVPASIKVNPAYGGLARQPEGIPNLIIPINGTNRMVSAKLGPFLRENLVKVKVAKQETCATVSPKDGSTLSTLKSQSTSCIHNNSLASMAQYSLEEASMGFHAECAASEVSNPSAAIQILTVKDKDTNGWKSKRGTDDRKERKTMGDQSTVKLTLLGGGSNDSETGSTSTQYSIPDGNSSLCIGSVEKIEV